MFPQKWIFFAPKFTMFDKITVCLSKSTRTIEKLQAHNFSKNPFKS